ncbi:MAG: hypothetical protein AAB646_02870 [Patescibacteria group bacterium]
MFGFELTKKDDEASGSLSKETCAVLWAILDIKEVFNPKIEIILPSYCMAQQCRTMVHNHGSEAIFLEDILIVFCGIHKPIAIRHAQKLGLEIIKAPILQFAPRTPSK